MITPFKQSTLPAGYHFGVLETPGIDTKDGCICFLRQIVMKNDLGCTAINGFTYLETYVHPYEEKYNISKAPGKQELHLICQALNFFLDNGMEKLYDISSNLVFDFFDYYRDKPIHGNEEHFVSDATLSLCVRTVSSFLCNLAKDGLVNIDPSELLVTRYMKSKKSKKTERKYVPIYQKKARPSCPSGLLRDIPKPAVEMLINLAETYDPMIRFAIVLQAYAGFRESEVMNIRQENSKCSNSPGLRMAKEGSAVTSMGFDLTREFVLRSDMKSVGLIKRRPKGYSPVYVNHLPIVIEAYEKHLQLLSHTDYDDFYKPMFINRNGKAMTSKSYCKRFNRLVYQYLRPRLLESNDVELLSFGQLLLTARFTPHALRHFFSLQLALNGEDVPTMMTYRGDSSPLSSLTYLQNKGALVDRAKQHHSDVLAGLNRIGEDIHAQQK